MELWNFDYELIKRREDLRSTLYRTYCLFCMSGNEVRLAKELNHVYSDVLALPFLRFMHKSRSGERSLAQDVLLKGYVFLYLPADRDIGRIQPIRTGFHVLELGSKNEKELKGRDRQYADWILSFGGILTVSKALRAGERVKIVEGPLLELEGDIVKYSKKNRNCRVEIKLIGRQISVWLPFDWIESEDKPVGVYEGGTIEHH